MYSAERRDPTSAINSLVEFQDTARMKIATQKIEKCAQIASASTNSVNVRFRPHRSNSVRDYVSYHGASRKPY